MSEPKDLVQVKAELDQIEINLIEAIANEPTIGHRIRRQIAIALIWMAKMFNSRNP